MESKHKVVSKTTVKLLTPIVNKELIPKVQYNTLPDYLIPIVSDFDHVWKVIITPLKSADSGLCRVNIITGANNRTGTLAIQNLGRIPAESPATNNDDLRPDAYYIWGNGSQIFQILQPSDTSNFAEVTVEFE